MQVNDIKLGYKLKCARKNQHLLLWILEWNLELKNSKGKKTEEVELSYQKRIKMLKEKRKPQIIHGNNKSHEVNTNEEKKAGDNVLE